MIPGGYNDFDSDLSKQIRLCITGSGAPGHVDVVGSVNTIRLRHYRWNMSKEGSLRAEKQ